MTELMELSRASRHIEEALRVADYPARSGKEGSGTVKEFFCSAELGFWHCDGIGAWELPSGREMSICLDVHKNRKHTKIAFSD